MTATETPTIHTTLGAIVAAEPALARVLTVKMDAKARYHAMKLSKLVSAETKYFYDEQQAAVKALGVERPPTGAERARLGPDPVTEVTAGNRPTYFARVKELSEVPVTLAWGPLTTEMLEPYAEIAGADLLGLGPLYELDPAPKD